MHQGLFVSDGHLFTCFILLAYLLYTFMPCKHFFPMQAFLTGEAEEELASVFDAPEAEPNELFINPFACNTSPLLWRELQVSSCHFPPPELLLCCPL